MHGKIFFFHKKNEVCEMRGRYFWPINLTFRFGNRDYIASISSINEIDLDFKCFPHQIT